MGSSSEEESLLTESSRRELECWLESRIRELYDRSFAEHEILAALEIARERVFREQ